MVVINPDTDTLSCPGCTRPFALNTNQSVARSKLEINVQTMCKGGKPSTAARTPLRMSLWGWVGFNRSIGEDRQVLSSSSSPLVCACQGSSPFSSKVSQSNQSKPQSTLLKSCPGDSRRVPLSCVSIDLCLSLFYTLSARLSTWKVLALYSVIWFESQFLFLSLPLTRLCMACSSYRLIQNVPYKKINVSF